MTEQAPKENSEIITGKDLHQTQAWGKYLEHLGWKVYDIEGTNVYMAKSGPIGIVKIQKAKNLTPEKLQKIEDKVKELKASFVKIEPFDYKDIHALKDAGYGINVVPLSNPSTIIVNLKQTEEVLWKNIKAQARYNIKRLNKEGIITKFYINPSLEIQQEFHTLLSQTGKTKQFYVQPFDDLNAKIRVFEDKSIIALTYKDNLVMASSLCLISDKTVYYVHAASSQFGRDHKAAYKHVWDLFIYFKNEGLEVFDFEGISDSRFPVFTKDWGGLTFFKRKFGGQDIKYPPPFIKYHSKFLRFFDKIAHPLPL